jgi:hypothetical protein
MPDVLLDSTLFDQTTYGHTGTGGSGQLQVAPLVGMARRRGLVSLNADPDTAAGQVAPTAARWYVGALPLGADVTLVTLQKAWIRLNVQGVGTAGGVLAVWNAALQLIGTSDISSRLLETQGPKDGTLTVTSGRSLAVNASDGYVYVGLKVDTLGGTPPQPARVAGGTHSHDMGTTAAKPSFGFWGFAGTAGVVPDPLPTPSGLSNESKFMFGLSGVESGTTTSTAAGPASLALYDVSAPTGALLTGVQLVPMENSDGTPALDEDGQQTHVLRRVVP